MKLLYTINKNYEYSKYIDYTTCFSFGNTISEEDDDFKKNYNKYNNYTFNVTINGKVIKLSYIGSDNNFEDSDTLFLKYKIIIRNNNYIIEEYQNEDFYEIFEDKSKWVSFLEYDFKNILEEEKNIIDIKLMVYGDSKIIIYDDNTYQLETEIEEEYVNYDNYEIINKFNKKQYNDIQIIINNDKLNIIYVSKLILSSQSEYFNSLFSSDMVDSNKNIIEINDVRYNTVFNTLKYMYTQNINDIINKKDENIIYKLLEIYKISDMWLMKKLSNDIINILIKNISISNIYDLLTFSNNYNLDNLKKIICYSRNNM